MLYFSKSGNVFVFENVFVKRRTWSSLASSLLVLLQLVFADLVPDPLQRDVELVLHPVHVLHSMSDFWSLHNMFPCRANVWWSTTLAQVLRFILSFQHHLVKFPKRSVFLGLSTKKLCHRPPWSCLQRLHPRPPRGRSPLQLLLQQDLHRPSLCQQLAAGGKVLQGTKGWWVSHLHQAIFARSDRFLHRCGMEAWQLRKCQGGGLPRWPGSQGGRVARWPRWEMNRQTQGGRKCTWWKDWLHEMKKRMRIHDTRARATAMESIFAATESASKIHPSRIRLPSSHQSKANSWMACLRYRKQCYPQLKTLKITHKSFNPPKVTNNAPCCHQFKYKYKINLS